MRSEGWLTDNYTVTSGVTERVEVTKFMKRSRKKAIFGLQSGKNYEKAYSMNSIRWDNEAYLIG